MTQSVESQNWGIIGAGAVGSLLASMLVDAQLIPRFIDARRSAHRRNFVVEKSGRSQRYSIETQTNVEGISVLLVCLKAWQVSTILASLDLPKSLSIVLVHNGMGTYDQLKGLGLEQAIYLTSNTHAARWKSANSLQQTGHGQLWLGHPLTSTAPPWFSSLEFAIENCTWTDDISQKLWLKLAINAVINPLTAINDCDNGQLLSDQYQATINALCVELSKIAIGSGVDLDAKVLQQNVRDICHITALNSSSMREDFSNARRSEIDYINGYFDKAATEMSIDCPINRTLYLSVLERDKNYA
ncbi:2-dehydropantoate 2-reductase [Alginatibacterium sediminis]|uniref:2-dehydropantoate 2-reductase n=1 Tax=Alginatibacterium sediminis TaxID=2164068 RepID=A0A420E8F8_9ALTE|nr:2-dehydropantoate 2-reductase [Alginatibacterium sediminis]RKF15643.1 2-dehydropantoate 2-reductase [Alginatibacterium sediminis]